MNIDILCSFDYNYLEFRTEVEPTNLETSPKATKFGCFMNLLLAENLINIAVDK